MGRAGRVELSETLPGWVLHAVADAAEGNRRREEAMDHFLIALATARKGLPVDWRHVALRMAEAVAAVPDAQEEQGPTREGA